MGNMLLTHTHTHTATGHSVCVCVCVCVPPTDLCVCLALLYVLLGLYERGLPFCVAGAVLRVSLLLLVSMATVVVRLTGTHPGERQRRQQKRVNNTMKQK